MKKTYLKPTVCIVGVNTSALMMNGSLGTPGGLEGVTYSGSAFNNGTVDSRHVNSVWGDDDDDDWFN